ncbi:MAG: amino acid aminotransferase [Flammeovirgaceae bacterium]|nr:amino acid aminotransferase [Flammeovirgaceae bacterium]|tara:strand:- start:10003 stop:10827 length:825 start_codon:yes stop_codon:yes gene_type:complete
MKCIINGQIQDSSQVSLPINDLAILRGYGIFDFFRLSSGIPLFIDDHLERFYQSAQIARLELIHSKDELKDLIYQLIEINHMPISGIRMVLTGGTGAGAYAIGKSNLIVTQEPIIFPSEEMFAQGVKLITHEYLRDIPHVKTINYMTGIWLQNQIKEAGAFDVLYHHQGLVHELTRSNIFIVNNTGELLTPANQVLHGITRKQLINGLKEEMEVVVTDVPIGVLNSAREVFITGTTKKVLPVNQIDNMHYSIGSVTKRIQEVFSDLEKAYLQNH